MSGPLRFGDQPLNIYEITTRTLQSRFLMLPTVRCRDLYLGIIGRAQTMYPFKLYGDAVMSNHYSMLIGVDDVTDLARIMCFINGNLAKELGGLYDWDAKLWGRRYRGIPVLDDDAQVDRLRYIFANSVKENLVERPERWPGAHCARALTRGELRRGAWVDRSALYEANRRWLRQPGTPAPRERDFTTWYTVEMTPLPCWSDKSEDERRELCRQIAREVSEDAAIAREYTGASVLGTKRLLDIDPHHRPEHTDQSPAPMCHASDPQTRNDWRARYDAYVEGYRIARDVMRKLGKRIDFPAGGILPLYRMEPDPPTPSAAAPAA